MSSEREAVPTNQDEKQFTLKEAKDIAAWAIALTLSDVVFGERDDKKSRDILLLGQKVVGETIAKVYEVKRMKERIDLSIETVIGQRNT